jgi:2,4-dienoyl-CoA reductase-like NADH-dependent reductase (Old Yellow Enzyme family)
MAGPPVGAASKLFEPMTIGNGKITLDHRVVFAPLTRNRGVPLSSESTLEKPNRIWLPSDLMVEYYSQRATNGGLVITEGVPPSLEVCDFTFWFILVQTRSSSSWSHRATDIISI